MCFSSFTICAQVKEEDDDDEGKETNHTYEHISMQKTNEKQKQSIPTARVKCCWRCYQK